jgi:hypothetical protein
MDGVRIEAPKLLTEWSAGKRCVSLALGVGSVMLSV